MLLFFLSLLHAENLDYSLRCRAFSQRFSLQLQVNTDESFDAVFHLEGKEKHYYRKKRFTPRSQKIVVEKNASLYSFGEISRQDSNFHFVIQNNEGPVLTFMVIPQPQTKSQRFFAFVVGKDPRTETTSPLIKMKCKMTQPTYASVDFDGYGKATGAPLHIGPTKIPRIQIGSLRNNKKKPKLEITSKCKRPQADTELICLPSNLYVSMFSPRVIDSHRSRSLFQVGGFEEVWIHDLNITIIPDSRWNNLYKTCSGTPAACEQQYQTDIEAMLQHDTIPISTTIQNVFLTKSGLFKDEKFDCMGNGNFNTLTPSSSWDLFQEKCDFPYTALWTYWKRKINMAAQLRRMGALFWLFDNQKIRFERNHFKGITGNGMIRALSNGDVKIENNTLEGISGKQLRQHGVDISDQEHGLKDASDNSLLMGTGISILEGSHGAASYSCSETIQYDYSHRAYCVGRQERTNTCQNDGDCLSDERCVNSLCKNSLCDTQNVVIEGNNIHGCTIKHWNHDGLFFNDDGIQLTSVSALLKNNSIYNFSGCDTLVDVGHRGPCNIREGEKHNHIRLEQNLLAKGKIKTTGAAAGENTVHFLQNNLYDVRLSDYHQYWISYYEKNNWHISNSTDQAYLWGEHSAAGAKPWQAPYYGSIIFSENNIYNNQKKRILLETKRYSLKKIILQKNTYYGQPFIWIKSRGETRVVPSDQISQEIFAEEDWEQQGENWTQPSLKIDTWETFRDKFDPSSTHIVTKDRK